MSSERGFGGKSQFSIDDDKPSPRPHQKGQCDDVVCLCHQCSEITFRDDELIVNLDRLLDYIRCNDTELFDQSIPTLIGVIMNDSIESWMPKQMSLFALARILANVPNTMQLDLPLISKTLMHTLSNPKRELREAAAQAVGSYYACKLAKDAEWNEMTQSLLAFYEQNRSNGNEMEAVASTVAYILIRSDMAPK